MASPNSFKSTTRNIRISEPDEEQLEKCLAGRDVSPKLAEFLQRITDGKRWTRKINIPSSHDNVAAVLIFTSDLKEGGLEISSELHVFYEDRVIVEKWQVLGERQQTSSLPTEMLRSLEIQKVRLEDHHVRVALRMSLPGGEYKFAVKIFDFSENSPAVRFVQNPFS